MKIRHRFVSNSSSSIFIIGLVNSTEFDKGEVFDDSLINWETNDWQGPTYECKNFVTTHYGNFWPIVTDVEAILS